MALDPKVRARVAEVARREGVDEGELLAAVERAAPGGEPSAAGGSPASTKPVADRLLVGFLPFIKVRELRSEWLGLPDRIPDDELTCGEYAAKHGAPAPAAAPSPEDEP